MEKPLVSVLVPSTTGGFMHLTNLMPGLAQECEQESAEIIVVDNGSRDGTSNYMGNYACTLIINKYNEGFAKAHNKAARKADGEYLLLLNNDTKVTPKFISTMRKTFEIDDKIGIVGCCIYTMDNPKRVQHAGVMFTDDYVPYELGLEVIGHAPGIVPNDDRVGSIREVPSVTAACMMIKKSVFEEVGGFDEEYINGWEDNDLVLKVREKGYKVWYNGRAVVFHKRFGSNNAGRFKYETQNRQRYDQIWVHTGRAKQVLGDFRSG